MGSFSKSSPLLFQLPAELFDMIVANIEVPKDYLNFARTCKAMWNTLDHDQEVILRDANLVRANAFHPTQHNLYSCDRYFPMLAWYLYNEPQNTSRLRRMAEVYFGVFPEFIRGSLNWSFDHCELPVIGGIDGNETFVSLYVWSIEQGNLELLKALMEMGMVPDKDDDPSEEENELQIAISSGQERVIQWFLDNFNHHRLVWYNFEECMHWFGLYAPITTRVQDRMMTFPGYIFQVEKDESLRRSRKCVLNVK
ncbi:hypothetical protein F5B20DRAFT_584791 [Whalleya microplaca]|nr:hypothetical protein F5B20DRAFT_584791 [Whalleya microplaca]